MEEALITYLLADSGVSSAVSNRMQWGVRPQGSSLPAIVLQRISGNFDYEFSGPSGLIESRIQIDTYAESYSSAQTAARAVIAAISGLRTTQGTIKFNGCFINSQSDTFERSNDGASKYHRVIVDLTIWHSSAS